jgi:hypothetical protein
LANVAQVRRSRLTEKIDCSGVWRISLSPYVVFGSDLKLGSPMRPVGAGFGQGRRIQEPNDDGLHYSSYFNIALTVYEHVARHFGECTDNAFASVDGNPLSLFYCTWIDASPTRSAAHLLRTFSPIPKPL